MTRMAWITDSHFDHSGPVPRNDLALEAAKVSDCCVITGDISNGKQLCSDLEAFQRIYGKPVYFILGNHDIYGSSFAQVHSNVEALCSRVGGLHWLADGDNYDVGDAQLCGVDGWYDYQAGLVGERLNVIMTDWSVTDEFKGLFAHYRASMDPDPLIKKLRSLGLQSAQLASETLANVTPRQPVFFATHVPPFRGAAWHLGNQTDDVYAPYFTNIALGFALNRWAEQNPDCHLTTLCGHVHSSGEYQARANHLVLTGKAVYGNPEIERIFEV